MDIQGYEDYYTISEDGRVYNKRSKKYLKASKNYDGYLTVSLIKDRKSNAKRLHRLVALHYIDNPENKETVDHIDRDITNNSVNNLRWATRSEQQRNKNAYSNTGYKYITKYTTKGYDYYRIGKAKVFCYSLRRDKWTLEEAVEIRDCLCRRHDVPLLEWVD